VLALTATATPEFIQDILTNSRSTIFSTSASSARTCLLRVYQTVNEEEKFAKLLNVLAWYVQRTWAQCGRRTARQISSSGGYVGSGSTQDVIMAKWRRNI